MNPLAQLLLLTCAPFIAGVTAGYLMRSYVSLARRSRS